MNRYKKIPGFTEEEIEKVTNCKILWKIPNNYQLIAPAIDKGAPVPSLTTRKSAAPIAHWPTCWPKPLAPPKRDWTSSSSMTRTRKRKPPAAC